MSRIKILPYEKSKYEDGDIVVNDVSITYCQNNDCTESRDNVQEIVISSRNNGIARFIHIKTDGWSISDETEIDELIKDFKKRASIIDEEEEEKD